MQDVKALQVEKTQNLSYVTQTTLSVDECRDIVEALHHRFPNIKGPHQEDICYATKSSECGQVLVEAGRTRFSSSGRRTVRTPTVCASWASTAAFPLSHRRRVGHQSRWLKMRRVSVCRAGASAPEVLVTEVVAI